MSDTSFPGTPFRKTVCGVEGRVVTDGRCLSQSRVTARPAWLPSARTCPNDAHDAAVQPGQTRNPLPPGRFAPDLGVSCVGVANAHPAGRKMEVAPCVSHGALVHFGVRHGSLQKPLLISDPAERRDPSLHGMEGPQCDSEAARTRTAWTCRRTSVAASVAPPASSTTNACAPETFALVHAVAVPGGVASARNGSPTNPA